MRHVNVLASNACVSMDISSTSLDPDISKLGLTILRLWQQFNLFQHWYTLSVQDIEYSCSLCTITRPTEGNQYEALLMDSAACVHVFGPTRLSQL